MKKIKLTQGQYALVDDEDFKRVNKFKWYAHRNYNSSTKRFYAIRKYPARNQKRQTLQMHNFILHNQKGKLVDHINRNTLDNRKCNLRIATYSQNGANSKKQKNNTSGYKGVSWNKSSKKWIARLMCRRMYIYLGCFNNKKEAAKAYNETAKKYFGKYAKLNNIDLESSDTSKYVKRNFKNAIREQEKNLSQDKMSRNEDPFTLSEEDT